MTHALVIGGSGMLRGTVIDLLKHYKTVSVVGRNPGKLQELQKLHSGINPINVDYVRTSAFIESIKKSVAAHGAVSLVVAWIHETAPEAPMLLASHLNEYQKEVDYYHVLSSEYARPDTGAAELRDGFRSLSYIKYHQVILGFIVERNRSRWLSNAEISEGVTQAINLDAVVTTVGVTEPWEMQP